MAVKRKPKNTTGSGKRVKHESTVLKTYVQFYHEDPTDNMLFGPLVVFSKFVGERPWRSVLYPGSYVDIVPSLVFPVAVYVDNFAGRNNEVQKFFDDPTLSETLLKKRVYAEQPEIRFHKEDFTSRGALAGEETTGFDALVSRSASGDISVTCAKFVRSGGFLIADDHFGDASLAMSSLVWTLEAACMQGELCSDLEKLFVLKKGKKRATSAQLASNAGKSFSARPCKYTENADFYLFSKFEDKTN